MFPNINLNGIRQTVRQVVSDQISKLGRTPEEKELFKALANAKPAPPRPSDEFLSTQYEKYLPSRPVLRDEAIGERGGVISLQVRSENFKTFKLFGGTEHLRLWCDTRPDAPHALYAMTGMAEVGKKGMPITRETHGEFIGQIERVLDPYRYQDPVSIDLRTSSKGLEMLSKVLLALQNS